MVVVSGCFSDFDIIGAKVGRGLACMRRLENEAMREVVVSGSVGAAGVVGAPERGAWEEWWAVLGPAMRGWGLGEALELEAVGAQAKYFCRYFASILGSMR